MPIQYKPSYSEIDDLIRELCIVAYWYAENTGDYEMEDIFNNSNEDRYSFNFRKNTLIEKINQITGERHD